MTFCNDYHFLEGVRIISFFITVLRIIIPVLLIGFGAYDYFQTVVNPEKASMGEKTKSFAFRVISAFMIFMLPTLINLIFSVVTNFGGVLVGLNDCLKNANKEYITQLKGLTQQNLLKYESQGNNFAGSFNAERYNQHFDDQTGDIIQTYDEYNNYDENNGSGAYNYANGDILSLAASLWQQVVNGSYSYGGTSIPPNGSTIDCSSFVSWVLYEFGYDDFQGYQHITQQFVNTNWQETYGWQEISFGANEDVTSQLQPGDILVRDSGDNNGHMNIIASVEADGTVMAYDCGSANNWRNSDGGPVAKNNFAKSDSRPGKIIRVTKPS